MEKLLEKLGLKADATEEEALAKLDEKEKQIKTLEGEKTSLSDKNKELTASVEGTKAELEKLKSDYIKKFEEKQEKEEKKEPLDLFDELSQN